MAREADSHRQQYINADRMASLGRLVSGVAHEINHANGCVRLGLDVLRDFLDHALDVLDDYCREHGDFAVGSMNFSEAREEIPQILDRMDKGSAGISKTASELLNFAHRRPGETTEDVDANAVVKEVVALLSHMIRKSTSRFEETYGEPMPVFRGDAQRLGQAVMNILVNACQALPSRDNTIGILTRHEPDRREIVVEVRDEGVGIAREDIGQVTSPFYTTKQNLGGAGLGLYAASRIVAQHQGRLEVVSTEGEGTTVQVILPIQMEGEGAV